MHSTQFSHRFTQATPRWLAACAVVLFLLSGPGHAQTETKTTTETTESESPTSRSSELGFAQAPKTAAQKQPLFDQNQMIKTVGGLFLIIALLLGLLWFMKRAGLSPGTRPGSFYKVLSVSSLGPKEKIALIEVGDTWLVVGMTHQSINTLHTMPKNSLEFGKPQVQAAEAFARMLDKLKPSQAKS